MGTKREEEYQHMKIAIFGAGKAGQYLYSQVKRVEGIEVNGFIDNKLDGQYEGVDILKPQDYFRIFKDTEAVFLAGGGQKTVKIMIDTLRRYGIDDIYMMHDIAGKCHLPVFSGKEIIPYRLRKIRFCESKPTLPYYEVPITDKCNLNCKGCLFACNVTGSSEHIDKAQILSDARRMEDLFCDIPWIRILGGEPLMHPDICEILEGYRKIFPEAEIDLCTNGLLLLQMEKEFFDCLIKNRISIHVSGYKPTYNLLDKIDSLLAKYKLPYAILKRDEFLKYYTTYPTHDLEKNYELCIASACREVYKGKLSTCSAAIAFEKFNDQFHTDFKVEKNVDWFDIHDENLDINRVMELIDKPARICQYCDCCRMESFDWSYASGCPSIKDYTI